jgi:hypothetical protein
MSFKLPSWCKWLRHHRRISAVNCFGADYIQLLEEIDYWCNTNCARDEWRWQMGTRGFPVPTLVKFYRRSDALAFSLRFPTQPIKGKP